MRGYYPNSSATNHLTIYLRINKAGVAEIKVEGTTAETITAGTNVTLMTFENLDRPDIRLFRNSITGAGTGSSGSDTRFKAILPIAKRELSFLADVKLN